MNRIRARSSAARQSTQETISHATSHACETRAIINTDRASEHNARSCQQGHPGLSGITHRVLRTWIRASVKSSRPGADAWTLYREEHPRNRRRLALHVGAAEEIRMHPSLRGQRSRFRTALRMSYRKTVGSLRCGPLHSKSTRRSTSSRSLKEHRILTRLRGRASPTSSNRAWMGLSGGEPDVLGSTADLPPCYPACRCCKERTFRHCAWRLRRG
jgi:hypothetical protein